MLLSNGLKARDLTLIVVAFAIGLMAVEAYGDVAEQQQLLIGPQTHATIAANADCSPEDPDFEDCFLLALMIEYAVINDAGLVLGFAPAPFGTIGEAVEYASNLALKFFPPWLKAPADRRVDPLLGPGTNYTSDDCGIEFELLSPGGEYTNLFGILNLREPYTRLDPPGIVPWRNLVNTDNTRWGFLKAPRVYHANTDVEVSIRTDYTVRRFNQNTGQLSEPFTPVNSFATGPQQVYLPIGTHPIGWYATTQLGIISDVILDPALFVIQKLAEVTIVKAGKSVWGSLKNVKKNGIGDNIAEEALDAQGAKRLSEGVMRFHEIWTKAFDARQVRKRELKAIKKFRQKVALRIARKYVTEVAKIYSQIGKKGFTSFDADTREEIKATFGTAVANTVEAVQCVYQDRYGTDFVERPSPGVDPGNCSGPIDVEFITRHLDDNSVSILQRVLRDHGVATIIDLMEVDTFTSVKGQFITVYDSVPPTISFDPEPYRIQGTDFGGTRLYRVRAKLLEMAEEASSDNCGRTPELTSNAPELLKLGLRQVIWTARDRGPNPPNDGQNYKPTAVQNILVEDTQPPLMLAPPSRVFLDTADRPLDPAEVGDAVAIDLVDVQPTVVNDAPPVFPLNSRTQINWRATDDSGNKTDALQLITVKETNTPPEAFDGAVATTTSVETNILLTATDADELDGQIDPLWFKIDRQPQNGEFVAPLYPFFIKDFRTRPNDGLGQEYDPETDELFSYIGDKFCDSNSADYGDPPLNFVHASKFVHVTDEGIHFVLDEFFECGDENGKVDTQRRFSKWDSFGKFLGQMQIGSSESDRPVGDAFRVDRDGLLHYNVLISPSTSSASLFLMKCPVDWTNNSDSSQCVRAHKFTGNVPVGENKELDAKDFAYARADSSANVAYVVANGIFAFETLSTGGVRFIGELGPQDDAGTVLTDWFGSIPSLEIDSFGAVYANDSQRDRIHKIAPIMIEDGEFVLGSYIGWAGKCTASGYGDCDLNAANPERGRSFGYSCTYDDTTPTCTSTVSSMADCQQQPPPPDPIPDKTDLRSGCRQGQFDTPRYIAIDPNDILYVADFENYRVQRLSTDGSFAGEAVSDGSGINKGDRPSFVIGNMGKPASVAVNSSQFFVVDKDEQFVHIFGSLPFKEIKFNEIDRTYETIVTYVSDQRFPNPNTIGDDTFNFSVSDGLESSDSAVVTVTVARAFRPPQAASTTVVTVEDTAVNFDLPAGDPDGVIGIDPLGLDVLTYKLIDRPEQGTLSGYAANWTYTPFPDFHGEDYLRFKVNDGVDDSNVATMRFEVEPVNDPPVVVVEAPERVARGFPLQLTSTFTDDVIDAPKVTDDPRYDGVITWGDGSSDVPGGFLNDGDDVSIEGFILVEPHSADAEGNAIGEHTYSESGDYTVSVCISDDEPLVGCNEVSLAVDDLVVLSVDGIFYDEPLPEGEITLDEIADGTEFTYEVRVINVNPSSGTGSTAADISLELMLPTDLNVSVVSIQQGSCAQEELKLSCDIGTLNPGAEVLLTMTMSGPNDLIYNLVQDFEGSIGTSSEALTDNFTLLSAIEIIADMTDSDGDGMSDAFEQIFGLNPAIGDSAEDADNDGVSNLDEFLERTSPNVADSDGDGVPDGDELMAGTDPLIDDIPPEITVPADIEVNAIGALTAVELGSATAMDFNDGVVPVFANTSGPFRPGHHIVTWSAVDEAGNRGDGFQFVKIVPIVSFHVDQAVSEGTLAAVRVELNGPAVNYPVTVPYEISGTALNPDDHDAVSGAAVIASGFSTDIGIAIVRDLVDEPDETIVVAMGQPTNAVAGSNSMHTVTVTELNLPPAVGITVEQQGEALTTISSQAGLIGIIADVFDDPAQQHGFDWSQSDNTLIDPVAVNDPAYLLDPSGLSAGLYDMHVDVVDDGNPQLASEASSLLKVSNEQIVLRSADDSDGDGLNDVADGVADSDGDRIANYLDDVPISNLLRLAPDGRVLETTPGLKLRLGATVFRDGGTYVSTAEENIGADSDYGYSSDVLNVEITKLEPHGTAQIVIPLAAPVAANSVVRIFANGQWQDLIVGLGDSIATAPGSKGACPPPGGISFAAGLTESHGCLQLTLTDGEANDLDGVIDSVVRFTGGLAVPIGARIEQLPQTDAELAGDGEVRMVRLRIRSDSGGALMSSLTLDATGAADEREIDSVIAIHDANRDGEWGDDDPVLTSDKFSEDDGTLTLTFSQSLKIAAGPTDILIVYVFGAIE